MPILVKLIAEPETFVSFALKAAPSLLGTLLGFVFALILAWLQRRNEANAKSMEDRKLHTSTLQLTVNACALNLENLMNLKSQHLLALAQDEAKVSTGLVDRDPAKVAAAMNSGLKNFFMSLSSVDPAELPHRSDFVFAVEEVPMFGVLVERAASAMREVNKHIEARNALLSDSAKASGAGQLSTPQLIYFAQMLSSEARNLSKLADYAMAYLKLVHDQAYELGKAKFSEGKFLRFEPMPDKSYLLPADDLIPGYRKQLVKFDSSGKPTKKPPQHD